MVFKFPHSGVGAHQLQGKRKQERKVGRVKKRKGIEAQMVKHPTKSRGTDALIGGEEQNGKQKREKKKQGEGPQPNYCSYDPYGSYGGPI